MGLRCLGLGLGVLADELFERREPLALAIDLLGSAERCLVVERPCQLLGGVVVNDLHELHEGPGTDERSGVLAQRSGGFGVIEIGSDGRGLPEVALQCLVLFLWGRVICVQRADEHLAHGPLGTPLPHGRQLLSHLVEVPVYRYSGDEVGMGVWEGSVAFDRRGQEGELSGVVGVLSAEVANLLVVDELGPVVGVFFEPFEEQVGFALFGHGAGSE